MRSGAPGISATPCHRPAASGAARAAADSTDKQAAITQRRRLELKRRSRFIDPPAGSPACRAGYAGTSSRSGPMRRAAESAAQDAPKIFEARQETRQAQRLTA